MSNLLNAQFNLPDSNSPDVYIITRNSCVYLHTALPVTVGIQQTAYTIGEVDEYQLVCFEVLSGDLDSREIIFDYTTSSGTASKKRIMSPILIIDFSPSF